MKTPAFKFSRLITAAACMLALSQTLPATDYIFSGTDLSPMSSTLTATDRILISGGTTGQVVISGTTFNVTDSVNLTKGITIGATAYGGTIMDASGTNGWALMNMTAAVANARIITVTESTTDYSLNLNHVILSGAYNGAANGAAMVLSGGVANSGSTMLTINGDVIFRNNSVGGASRGAALYISNNSVTFTGNVVFENNRAGFDATTGNFANTGAGGAVTLGNSSMNNQIVFNNNVSFINNMAGGQGGALMLLGNAYNQKVTFNGNAVFMGNTSGNYVTTSQAGQHGGAIFVSTNNAGLEFNQKAVFIGNKATGAGGGIAAYDNIGELAFKNGGIFQYNVAGAPTPGGVVNVMSGGALSVNKTDAPLTLLGDFLFLSNTASQHGGAIQIAGHVSPNSSPVFDFEGTGTLAGNIASTGAGGAINFGSQAGGLNNVKIVATGSSGIVIASNTAGTTGGAFNFGGTSATVLLSASNGDIQFYKNTQNAATTAAANDMYFANTGQIVTMDASAGRKISIGSGISNAASGVITNIVKTGSGTLEFANSVSDINANTTVSAGDFRLTNASYGRANTGTFVLQTGAMLDGSGTLTSSQVTLNNNSTVRVTGGGNLVIAATTLTQVGAVKLAGNGKIDAGSNTLVASDVSLGDVGHTSAQNLTLAGGVDLTNATVHVGLFGATNDSLSAASANAATATTVFDFNDFINGTYTLINTTGATTVAGSGNFGTSINGVALSNARLVANYTVGANSIAVTLAKASAGRTWTGAAGNLWSATTASWNGSDSSYLSGDVVIFNLASGGTIAVDQGGVLTSGMYVNSAGNFTYTGGVITTDSNSWQTGTDPLANGKLNKDGAGTLTFSNTGNTFKQGIALNAGVIAFSSAAQINTVNPDTAKDSGITFTGSGTLRPNAAGLTINNAIAINSGVTGAIDTGAYAFTYGGTLGGAGTLAKTGTGVLTMTSANNTNFAGTTAVNNGTLLLANGSKLGGALNINSGATLAGTGAATGNVNANAGSKIIIGSAGSATAETLTTGNLTLNGAVVYFDMLASSNDKIITNALALAGTNTFDLSAAPVTGTYTLITATSPITGNVAGLQTLINGSNLLGRTTITYAISGNNLNMTVYTSNAALIWSGSNNALWNTSDANWVGTDTQFKAGDSAIFDSVTDAAHINNRNITVAAAGVLVASATVQGSGTYVFNGGAIITTTDTTKTNIANPTGKFTMAGTGLVIFSNTGNSFANGLEINSGAVQGTLVTLGTNAVAVNSTAATLNVDLVTGGTYRANVTGTGNVTLMSSGTMIATGTMTYTGTMNVATLNQNAANTLIGANGSITVGTVNQNTGAVLTTANSSLRASTYNLNKGAFIYNGGVVNINAFNITASGTFIGSNTTALNIATLNNAGAIFVGKAYNPALATYGSLTVNGNYVGNGGKIVLNTTLNTLNSGTAVAGRNDQFNINGNASGKTIVHVTVDNPTTGGAPTGTGPTDGIKLISISGANTGTFLLDRRVVGGVFDYGLVAGTNGMYLQATLPSPEIPAVTSLPAMAVFMGQTALDSVLSRMGEIRFDPEHPNRGWWIRNAYNNTQFKVDAFPNTREHTNVFQVGYDRTFMSGWGDANWSLGAYYSYTQARGEVNYTRGDITNGANGGGLYALMQKGPWYFDATVKMDKNHYSVNAPRYSLDDNNLAPGSAGDTFSSDGWNTSAAIEFGYAKQTGIGVLEPEAQLNYQFYNFDQTMDDYNRGYTFGQTTSLLARLGLRWRGSMTFENKNWLMPWIRVSASHEFLNEYNINVRDAVNANYGFRNDMRGDTFTVDGGFTWGFNSQFSINLNAAFSSGDTSKGYTISGGVRYIW